MRLNLGGIFVAHLLLSVLVHVFKSAKFWLIYKVMNLSGLRTSCYIVLCTGVYRVQFL